ncbi:MAG: hypothetical protein GYB49_09560 [Alphaproteobacteria bacterium]|nr:hypothetical protein [Alphaproteobacteria bacterium]|tara:strand:+ start:961 stop:3333 length:2373 start_codon:yes stop_codon:yes gene_type:complete
MGQVTILHSLTDPNAREVIEWSGPYIDFLEQRFPDGFSQPHKTVDMATGEEVWGEDALQPVGERSLALAFSPGGLDPITAAVIIVASVAISLAVTFLLTPKAPNQNGEQGAAGTAYSVTAQANQARLGAPIPEQFGQWERTPEYASQSYRLFAGDEEIRYFLLCLGAGDHQFDAARIGDTPISDLPAGIVEYEIYRPADHTSTLGVIEADFGIHENVETSGEVDSQAVEQGVNYSDTSIGSCISGGNALLLDNQVPTSLAAAGADLIITAPAEIAGTYTVESIETGFIQIVETFPEAVTGESITFRIQSSVSITVGPFVANRSGTTTQKLELDFEFPNGLYRLKDDGNFQDLTITIRATVQEIDDNGVDVGSATNHNFTISAATNNPIRRSYIISKAAGRYKVSVQRTDTGEIRARDSQRTAWTGLKAYLDYDNTAPRYGDVTLVAMKITGSQGISNASQSRIFVKSTRIINQLGTSTPVAGGNLADVMSHIYVNQVGRPASEMDSTAFSTFRTAQASRSGFNGVFDTVGTVWSALETVASLGRARPYPKGMTLSLVTDGVKTRSSLVAPHNTLKGGVTVQYNWIDPGGNDGVVIEYFDGDTYERKTTSWPLSEDDLINPKQQRALGLTDGDEALSMAKYIWRQLVQRNVEFSWRMELDGRNFKPYDRVGLVVPDFNWAQAAFVTNVSGNSITLDKVAPSGALSVILRDQDGTASDVLAATGDGTNTIVLDDQPPFTLEYDGTQVSTICAFSLTADFTVQDVLIQKAVPSGNSTSVEAVNYDATIFDGLV